MDLLLQSLNTPDEVKNLMAFVNRKHFTMNQSHAYRDSPSPLTDNQTISAPHMHAKALEYMWPVLMRPNSHVLDIGSGSGYLTACFGYACRVFHPKHTQRGKVIGVDIYKNLVTFSNKVISKHYPELKTYTRSFKIEHNDGYYGIPKKRNKEIYDGIHIGAACESFPTHLYNQLKKGGIMVAPLRRNHQLHFCIITKDENGKKKIHETGLVNYVPLV